MRLLLAAALALPLAMLPASSSAQVGNGSAGVFPPPCPSSSSVVIDCQGAGSPTFSCVHACIYHRTDGGAGSTLYYCTGTTNWVAIPNTPAISFTSGAGVPTAGANVGDIYRSTDGTPGTTLWQYVGSFSGLPYVVNWGISTPSGTGLATVTMLRTITQNNLLLAYAAENNVGDFTLQSGWTASAGTGSPTPACGSGWKIAAAGDVGTTTKPYSFSNLLSGSMVLVVEVANFNTTTPIAFSGAANNGITNINSVTQGGLVVAFTSQAPNGDISNGQSRWEQIVYGMNAILTAQARSYPLVLPFENGLGSTFSVMNTSNGCGAILVIGTGAGSSNLWVPFA